MVKAGDLFLVEKAAEDSGVALFFTDEELSGGGEIWRQVVQLGGAAEEASAIGAFAKLEAREGEREEVAFERGELRLRGPGEFGEGPGVVGEIVTPGRILCHVK